MNKSTAEKSFVVIDPVRPKLSNGREPGIQKIANQFYDFESLPAVDGCATTYRDSVVPFLFLEVKRDGRRAWLFSRRHGNRNVSRRVSDAFTMTVTQARTKAVEWASAMENEDTLPPTVRQRRNSQIATQITVESVFEAYFEQHVKRHNARPEEIRKGFEKNVGSLKTVRVKDLNTARINAWKMALADRLSKSSAQRYYNVFRAAINWAGAMGMVDVSPRLFEGVKGFKSQHRTRYLKHDEVSRLIEAIQGENVHVRDVILLLLFTGQRKSNVLSMQWNELDLASGVWCIPAHKTKTSRDYYVPLVPEAIALLKQRQAANFASEVPRGFYGNLETISRSVFPPQNNGSGSHLRNIDHAWRQARHRVGLDDLNLHDLRHTTATWLAQAGASAFDIQRVLNHSNVAMSSIYVNLNVDDTKKSLTNAFSHATKGAFAQAFGLLEETDEIAAKRRRSEASARDLSKSELATAEA